MRLSSVSRWSLEGDRGPCISVSPWTNEGMRLTCGGHGGWGFVKRGIERAAREREGDTHETAVVGGCGRGTKRHLTRLCCSGLLVPPAVKTVREGERFLCQEGRLVASCR